MLRHRFDVDEWTLRSSDSVRIEKPCLRVTHPAHVSVEHVGNCGTCRRCRSAVETSATVVATVLLFAVERCAYADGCCRTNRRVCSMGRRISFANGLATTMSTNTDRWCCRSNCWVTTALCRRHYRTGHFESWDDRTVAVEVPGHFQPRVRSGTKVVRMESCQYSTRTWVTKPGHLMMLFQARRDRTPEINR